MHTASIHPTARGILLVLLLATAATPTDADVQATVPPPSVPSAPPPEADETIGLLVDWVEALGDGLDDR